MRGPSATEKPSSAKIAVISSLTWLTGCRLPWRCGRDGRVTSSHSSRRRASSAASASPAFLAASAELSSSFRAFNAGPATWRSSGVILPSSRIFRLTSPFLPTAATRIASSAASSPAPAICSRYFAFRSSIAVPRGKLSAPCYHIPRRTQDQGGKTARGCGFRRRPAPPLRGRGAPGRRPCHRPRAAGAGRERGQTAPLPRQTPPRRSALPRRAESFPTPARRR